MDIKELVGERLAILSVPPAPKPKPRYRLIAVESRDWVAVYHVNDATNIHIHPTHFPFNILYRKYHRGHTALNVESVKFILENAGHFVTIV